MIVYVLETDLYTGVFARLSDALAYPVEAGLVAVDVGPWQLGSRDGQREWVMLDGEGLCVVTEQQVIGQAA